MANEDLSEIEKMILERKKEQTQAVTVSEETPTVPVIPFEKVAEKREQTAAADTTSDLVETAFNQAIVHKVATDESVQEDLLKSAKRVVKNKTGAIRERADMEDKAAFFNNRKGACECFGYNEATTPKWAVFVMNFWHNIATAIWILCGCFTFAPITFVAKKITVIFKKSWVAILLSIVIYIIIVAGIPFLTAYLNK